MKRIYSDIPVQSVLFTMRNNVHVIIEDYRHNDLHFKPGAAPVAVWEGGALDLHSYENYRFCYAKVHEIIPEDGTLRIKICTEFEQF